MAVRADLGMVFQEGALLIRSRWPKMSDMYEETQMPADEVRNRVEEVLGFIRLGEYIDRMPSELSGGRRRVAIACSRGAKPVLLLYDEPTTGIDPITAITVDDEIIKLRDLENVSSILVTHQLRDAFYVATHEAVRRDDGLILMRPADEYKCEEAEFIMLKEGRIAFEGHAAELRAASDSYLRSFLS